MTLLFPECNWAITSLPSSTHYGSPNQRPPRQRSGDCEATTVKAWFKVEVTEAKAAHLKEVLGKAKAAKAKVKSVLASEKKRRRAIKAKATKAEKKAEG